MSLSLNNGGNERGTMEFSLVDLDKAYGALMSEVVKTGQWVGDCFLFTNDGGKLNYYVGGEVVTLAHLDHPMYLMASFPPFNNQPTQYRISVDGEQKWFAQCGFEALACRWLFPGKTVRIDAPCLLGGEPLTIEMKDEEILLVDPNTIVGYTRSPVGGEAANRPFR